jgi:hypothetical protein
MLVVVVLLVVQRLGLIGVGVGGGRSVSGASSK